MRTTFKNIHDRIEYVEWIVALAVTVLIVYLHILFMLNAGALWRDEVNTLHLATMPTVSDIWTSLRYDSFPLMSSLVLRVWIGPDLIMSDTGIRILGFLVGFLILGALWLSARQFGNSVPLLSLTLFGCSALTIRYGDAIRPYGLGILFILISFGLIWKVIYSPTFRNVFAAATAAILSVQFMYTNAVLLFAIYVGGATVAFYNRMWKRLALLVGTGIGAAVSLLPYQEIIRQAQDWIPLVQVSSGLQDIFKLLIKTLGASGSINIVAWISLFVLGIVAAVYLLIKNRKESDKRQNNIALFSVISMISALIIYIFFITSMKTYPQPWHFLPMIAIIAVSLDAVLGANKKPFNILRIFLAVLIIILTFYPNWQEVQKRQTNLDIIASELEKSATKNDMLLVYPWYYGITFQRYYKGDARWMSLPPIGDLVIHRYDLLKKKMMSINPIEPVLSQIRDTLKSGNRLWLVGGLPRMPEGRMPPYLPPAPTEQYGWNNGVYLYTWSMQAGHAVQSHGLYRKILTFPSEKSINPFENVHVEVITGWK